MGQLLAIGPDPVVAAVLSDSLDGLGFQVKTVLKSEEALKALDSLQPDLVLVDIEGLGGDCTPLLEALRRGRPSLPVLTISRFLTGADRTRILEAGAAELLFKPVHREELRLRIERLAGASPGRAAALSGRLEDSPTWEVLQHLDTAGKAGRLSVRSERRRGYVEIAAGVVSDARCGGLRGEEAVLAFLGQHEGRFEFVADDAPKPPAAEGLLSIRKCLMEGAWLADEYERLRPHAPPTGAPLRVVEGRIPELPDPSLPWLPTRQIVEYLRAHPDSRPFDLADQDWAAPRRLSLALAWLVSVGALEVVGNEDFPTDFPSTREIARSRLLEASLEALVLSLRDDDERRIALFFEPSCLDGVRRIFEETAEDWRQSEIERLLSALDTHRRAAQRLVTEVGTLELHLEELAPAAGRDPAAIAPHCARVMIWVRSLLHPRIVETLLRATDGGRTATGRLVVAQPPGVRDRVDALLRDHPLWRSVDHEPESVLGLLRFFSLAGEE